MELEKFHKEGGPFPDYLDREFVILLEASYGEGQSTLLVLPDSPERLERLLCRTGIRDKMCIRDRACAALPHGHGVSSSAFSRKQRFPGQGSASSGTPAVASLWLS